MTNLIKPAIAGSLESSDVQINIAPNPGRGIDIDLDSIVKPQFGEAILATAQSVLNEFGITDARLTINDKGAVDAVLRARMQTAIHRSAESR